MTGERFYIRVWCLDGEVVNVNSKTDPITHDAINPRHDCVINAVVEGEYMMAVDVQKRLRWDFLQPDNLLLFGRKIIVQSKATVPFGNIDWQMSG